ncbi:MAG: DegT/DnrJ/EryC1/StrS family aminotransferase, partial [Thaumarchaeota archaeon]|nr:DegT/DnrJ/EryC1/StrS family aminotransferase [Nitrososphaerota archaeon]
ASGWISGRGKNIVEFESEFSNWQGTRNTITCSSGTAALHLALTSIGVKNGDEVIIPAFSMGAVAFSVSYTGARLVLVDSELESWNMDPSLVEQKMTSKTKAVIAMHTYGHPAQMDPIIKLCNEKNITLIEDAAEAHGAEYQRKKVGNLGKIGCFSFFSNKIITTGEGGAVVTSDEEIAEKTRILRDMAFSKTPSKKFLHEYVGFNYRMTNMQAALGRSQLKRIQEFIDLRRKNASLYNELLADVKGLTTPPEQPWAKNIFWMYSVLVKPSFGMSRDALMVKLGEMGIETRPFFVPVHQQPVYASDFSNEKHPISEGLSIQGLNLPSGNTLTEAQVRRIAESISSIQKQ